MKPKNRLKLFFSEMETNVSSPKAIDGEAEWNPDGSMTVSGGFLIHIKKLAKEWQVSQEDAANLCLAFALPLVLIERIKMPAKQRKALVKVFKLATKGAFKIGRKNGRLDER